MNKLSSVNSSALKLNAEKNFSTSTPGFSAAQSRLGKEGCSKPQVNDSVSFSDELEEEQLDPSEAFDRAEARLGAVIDVNRFLFENGRDGLSQEERQQVIDFVTEQGFPDLVSMLPPAKKSRFFGMFG